MNISETIQFLNEIGAYALISERERVLWDDFNEFQAFYYWKYKAFRHPEVVVERKKDLAGRSFLCLKILHNAYYVVMDKKMFPKIRRNRTANYCTYKTKFEVDLESGRLTEKLKVLRNRGGGI